MNRMPVTGMELRFAKAMNTRENIPKARPPKGIIHSVGSMELKARDVATPMIVPIDAARQTPNIFGQYAALVVLHSLAITPLEAHQDIPAPTFISNAIIKLSILPPGTGAIGSHSNIAAQPPGQLSLLKSPCLS